MDLEELSRKMPAPALAACVIFVAIVVFFVMQPPHTICDTQKESLKESQRGILFPQKVGKRTYPGRIQQAMDSCRMGNSSGACYDYFNILRRVAVAIKNGSPECTADVLDISIERYAKMEKYETLREGGKDREILASVDYSSAKLSKVLEEGLEMMVVKAWGEVPPEPGPSRFGWMQESELAVFCHVQDVVRRAKDPESWQALQVQIMTKLPGEKRPEPVPGLPAPPGLKLPIRPAVQVFSEQQIRSRSLFSASCGQYR